MKRALTVVLCAGCIAGSHATVSRILSMGKHDAFFMDETSVFRNPANVNVYPNMLMGATGEYRVLEQDTTDLEAQRRLNRDPRDPFFGAILTYSFRGEDGEQSRQPMLSVGGVFNRKDETLSRFSADYGQDLVDTIITRDPVDPVGKVDVMVGYATASGIKLGVGTYLAFQRIVGHDGAPLESSLYRGNVGVNWPVTRTMDVEASLGVGALTIFAPETTSVGGIVTSTGVDTLAYNDLEVLVDLRMFSAMSAINGDFVPHVAVEWSQFRQNAERELGIAAGLGLNVNIDKGFFWAGIEAVYEQKDVPGTRSNGIGGRVSFGIERNVVWDWFVVRVGGQKSIMYVSEGGDSSYFKENPEHDADDDLIGLGIGLNVENRLKFDILVAEDVVHTLTNLFSGPQHHVFTRIDATFSF